MRPLFDPPPEQVGLPVNKGKMFRDSSQTWVEAQRQGVRNEPIRGTLAISEVRSILPGRDRHTLSITNLSASVDLQLGHSADTFVAGPGRPVAVYKTLPAGTQTDFEIHYSGLEPVNDGTGRLREVFHCEWDDAVFLKNPSAVDTVDFEVLEVA